MRKNMIVVSAISLFFLSANFYAAAQTGMNLDAAIQSTVRDIESRLPNDAYLAMVNFVSGSPALSDYIIEELTMGLMDSGKIFVIDRNTLNRALVNAEIDLQLSGDVSDAAMVSIGKLTGSQYTLSGSFSGSGNSFRFEAFLTDARTQRRQSIGAKTIQNNARLTALMNQRGRPESAIPNNPLTALEFLKRAVAYADRGEYAKAVADYTEVLGSGNFISRLFIVPYGRGEAYRELGRYNEAIADYTLAIERNGEFAAAFLERGLSYAARTGEFLAAFRERSSLDPARTGEFVAAFRERVLSDDTVNDFNKALADLNRAVQLTPNFPNPYMIRSTIYSSIGEFDKAIADILYAIKLDPNRAGCYRGLCLTYILTDELEKAEEAYRTAFRLEPKAELTRGAMGVLCSRYMERGTAHGMRGNHNAAIADFTRVIGIDPTGALAFANRGMGYFNLGELDKAVADLELAVKYSPANTQYKSALDRIRRQRDIEAAWGN